ncbi:uncharacterized protein ACRADG_008165 isoform 1-T5 [Cochliomyia hominivorax]
MLHDPAVDDCQNSQLNFNLSSSLSKQNLNFENNLQNCSQFNPLSASSESLIKNSLNNEGLDIKKENSLISFSLNSGKSDLLPSSNSGEKLSWKFFEQVDSLDNQLRSDVSSPPCVLLNGGGKHFLTSSARSDNNISSSATNDVNLIVAKTSLNALGGMHSHTTATATANGQTQSQIQTHIQTSLPQGCNRLMRPLIQPTQLPQQQQLQLQM